MKIINKGHAVIAAGRCVLHYVPQGARLISKQLAAPAQNRWQQLLDALFWLFCSLQARPERHPGRWQPCQGSPTCMRATVQQLLRGRNQAISRNHRWETSQWLGVCVGCSAHLLFGQGSSPTLWQYKSGSTKAAVPQPAGSREGAWVAA